MKSLAKVLLPVVILLIAGIGTVALVRSKEKPETRPPEAVVPVVRTMTVRTSDVALVVKSQGTVSPRTESVLIPEVSGRIIEVARSFVSGGFFEEGDVLVRVDAHDYEQALIRARAQVTQAELGVALQEAEADVAQEEWQEIGVGDAGPLNLREPQLADARARLEAARAGLETARRDLERTTIVAPYAGRIRTKQVDVGQYVTRGAPLATIYSVDVAEIRLPLPDADLAYIDLPLVYRGESETARGPAVTLRAHFAGREFQWQGRIVRTEGEIDPRSRMVHAVAQVVDPYGLNQEGRPPLAAGLFVEAEIQGVTVEDVVVIPRSALREGDRVLVLDDENRIRLRATSSISVRRRATSLQPQR